MQIESLHYASTSKAWSRPFPKVDSPKTLLLTFGAPGLVDSPAILQELARAFPRSTVIGASSEAPTAASDATLEVVIVQFEHTTLSAVSTSELTDAFAAGQDLANKLSKPGLRAVILFADGADGNGAELVRGFGHLDASIAILGGVAGGVRESKSWTIANGVVKSRTAVAVGLYGEHLVVKTASRTGWSKLGPERTVSKADGRSIFDLDGKPALSVLDEHLAMAGRTRAGGAPIDLPFSVRASARHDRSLIRTVVAIDEKTQALRMSVDVPQGYLVQPLSATPDALLESAAEVATSVCEPSAVVGKGALALVVSHAGRRQVVSSGERTEAAAVTANLPVKDAGVVAGMYGLGEISPQHDGHPQLNNQSITLSLFMESPTPIAKKKSGVESEGGPIRPQAPTTKAGPAAHLRSRNPTVDDLFSELELDGQKRVAARPAGRPPMPPPSRGTPSKPRVPAVTPPPVPIPPAASTSPAPVVQVLDEVAPSARHTQRPPAPQTYQTPHSGIPAQGIGHPQRAETGTPSTLSSATLRFASGAWTIPAGMDSQRTLVMFFGSPTASEAAQALGRAMPSSHVVGCATEQVLGAPSSETVAIAAKFEKTELVTAWTDLGGGPQAAASALGQQIGLANLKAVLLFADPAVDADALVRALRSSLPPGILIAGATTAATRPWLVADSTVRGGIAVAVAFFGEHVAFGVSSKSAFEPFGPTRQVTGATNRTITEIDGRPALPFIQEQMGVREPDKALRIALQLTAPGQSAPVSRTPVSVDPQTSSLTFASPIVVGSSLRLTRVNHEHMLDEVSSAAGLAKVQNPTTEGDAIVLIAANAMRVRSLGARAEEQVAAATDAIPSQVSARTIGLTTTAEIGGASDVQSGAVSVLVLSEVRSVAQPRPAAPAPAPAPAFGTPAPGPVHPAETPSPAQVARATSRPSRPQVTRPLLSASTVGSTGVKITKSREGDVTVVNFAGRITESFKGDQLGRELSGTVVFDLAKVERITSFGVREWLQMLGACQERVKKLYLAHCSEAIVNQISMIRKFAGGAQVLSFFGPYLCDSCGEQFERLFDVEGEGQVLLSHTAPEVMCPQCGGRAHFDDDPETFFAFAPNHVDQPVPLGIRVVHDGIAAAPTVRSSDAVEKTVEGTLTRVRVVGRAAHIRWQRIFDGAEGVLVVELGGLGPLDEVDLQAFEQALMALPPEVEAVRLERCPHTLVEHFAAAGVPKKVVIASTTLVGHCNACNNQRPALVVVDEQMPNLLAGRPPAIHCRRCNGLLDLSHAQTVLGMLVRQRRRPSLQPPPGFASTPTPPLALSNPPPVVMPPEPPPPVIHAEAVAPLAASSRMPTAMILASALVVSVALIGSAAVLLLARRPPALPPPTPTAMASNAPGGWSPVGSLPPAWVERSIVIEPDSIFIVGRCEKASSPEAALHQTRSDAVIRLVKQLQVDLGGAQEGVARVKEEDFVKREPAIVERLLRHAGSSAQPERGETVVREREGTIEGFARYKISRAAYQELLSTYKRPVNFHGIPLVRAFPSLDLPTDVDVLVASSAPRAEGAPRGGDLLKAVAGRPVTYADIARPADEWFGVAANGLLAIDFDRDDTVVSAKVRRPPMVAFAPPPPPRPLPPPAPRTAAPSDSSTPPPGRDLGLPALNYRDGTSKTPKKTP